MVIWRYLWAFPATSVGLAAAGLALVSGGRLRVVRGVLEVHGGLITRILSRPIPFVRGCAAMTLGHVILGRDDACLQYSREHEHVHVRQYERWGALMIPAYFTAGAWLWCRGYHPYLDNPFELEAYGKDHGVAEPPDDSA